MDPEGKVGHWSARMKNTKEGCEEVQGFLDEKQGSKI